jgi:hypothetical protein
LRFCQIVFIIMGKIATAFHRSQAVDLYEALRALADPRTLLGLMVSNLGILRAFAQP